MNSTLYLTEKCNMACSYCFEAECGEKCISKITITPDTARAVVDYSISRGDKSTGICFFGGEPLLCRDTLYELIGYCNSIKEKTGHHFSFKLVTNGTLLDDEFLRFATDNGIIVALSHDGLMQDDCRLYPDGRGTFAELDEKINLLLRYQPYAIAMMTIDPSCTEKLAPSAEYLFNKGFRNIITTPRYASVCPWDDDSFAKLEKSYEELAELYVNWTLGGYKFSLIAFDSKIQYHILGGCPPDKNCRLGEKQVTILPDGKIYPCQQFVEDKYLMGDVFKGIIPERLDYIKSIRNDTPVECSDCGLKSRCRYNCCCLNKQCTGSIGSISPFQCNYEQLLIRCADKAAERLYSLGNTDFMKKQYSKFYSLIEI